jgi:hypothetical protein
MSCTYENVVNNAKPYNVSVLSPSSEFTAGRQRAINLKCTIDELIAKATELELNVNGTKNELLTRILEHMATLPPVVKAKPTPATANVLFKCNTCSNEFNLTKGSFATVMTKLRDGTRTHLCPICITTGSMPTISTEENAIKQRCSELGFLFHGFDRKTRTVNYTCVCGESHENVASGSFGKDRKAQCLKCQNNADRHTYDEVKATFHKNDSDGSHCILLIKPTEYVNRQTPMPYICRCKFDKVSSYFNRDLTETELSQLRAIPELVTTIRYADFIKGGRCGQCKVETYIKTVQERYGYDNVAQVPQFIDKAKETRVLTKAKKST